LKGPKDLVDGKGSKGSKESKDLGDRKG